MLYTMTKKDCHAKLHRKSPLKNAETNILYPNQSYASCYVLSGTMQFPISYVVRKILDEPPKEYQNQISG